MAGTYSPESLGISAPSGGFQQGGWYSGRQYWGGTLSDPGVIHPSSNQQGAGQAVSQEVVQQTAPENWQYIQQQQQIQANQIQAPVNISLPSTITSLGLSTELEAARKVLDQSLASQQAKTQEQLEAARAKEQATLAEAEPLTRPFREELEKTERERYGTEEVLVQQKELLNELDQLLTEGNELIRQQQQVTGLAAIRNPRIQQTMEDVAARAGVINAVVALQNTYLANAYQSIDRSINAITQDRQDRLSYYNTILSLANRDIVELTSESRRIAQEQTNLLKFDLENAQKTVDMVKSLMLDPASALLMAQAGVSLNDSVETINSKMAQAVVAQEVRKMSNEMSLSGYTVVTNPKSVPADKLVTITDSNGNKYYYKKISGTGTESFDTSGFVQGLLDSGFKVDSSQLETGIGQAGIESIWNEVLNSSSATYAGQPIFTPSGGIGTTWTDTSGQKWRYTSQGWVKV